ncbi:MAG: transposase [Patescibacteria group bacterium]
MSRPLRIVFPGAFYHITSRGNEKKDIFFSNEDRMLFLRVLGRVVEERNWICHAYVLMTNHYHLLIETPDANLSEGMRQLNGIYTQKINQRYGRVGHVLQGRFNAFLIEDETYFLTVARYIVLNPLRTALVGDVCEYEWSSYLGTLGAVPKKTFLTTEKILSLFSSHKHEAQKRYDDFVNAGRSEGSPFRGVKNGILGSDQFVLEVCMDREGDSRLMEVPRSQRILGRPSLRDIFSDGETKVERNALIYTAVLHCGYSFSEIARHVGLHYSQVGRIFRGLQNAQCKT